MQKLQEHRKFLSLVPSGPCMIGNIWVQFGGHVSKFVVITSINPPRPRIREFIDLGYKVIVVGDTKSDVGSWDSMKDVIFLDTPSQETLFPKMSEQLGWKTYARKNIGYLHAVALGASVIWETDDDTFPRAQVGDPLHYFSTGSKHVVSESPVWNPYNLFAPDSGIWPRGFPLELLSQSAEQAPPRIANPDSEQEKPDVIQTLVNLEPDVDAIYRLTVSDDVQDFPASRELVSLAGNVVSPGNTQSTFWLSPRSFEYLYFPSSVSNRFADILKMYVAQTSLNLSVAGFLTEQIRNPHDYMDDFRQEVEMYESLSKLLSILESLKGQRPSEIYRALAVAGICTNIDVAGSQLFEETLREIANR